MARNRGSQPQNRLALLMRTIYMMEYQRFVPSAGDYGRRPIPKWDGGVSPSGRHYQSVWPDVAAFVLRLNADPYKFIRAQFLHAKPGMPPRPNQLTNDGALMHYRTYSTHAAKNVSEEHQRQLNSFHQRLLELRLDNNVADERARVITALCDQTLVHATPLFRYVMAVKADLPSMANKFYEGALYEYLFEMEHYNACWGEENIPEQLRQHATALRARLAF